MPLKIVIFDDNINIRESITLLLSTVNDFRVVGSFSNVLHCLDDLKKKRSPTWCSWILLCPR